MAKSFFEQLHSLNKSDVRGERSFRERQLRVARAAGLVLLVLVLGTLGYYFLTDDDTDLLRCLYMTVITVSTVGFSEAVPVREQTDLMDIHGRGKRSTTSSLEAPHAESHREH